MSAFTSLEEATEPMDGLDRRLQKTTAHHTMAVWTTGNPSNVVVVLEGSHDSYNWFPLGTLNLGGGGDMNGLKTTQPTAHLASWVRTRLALLEGGTSPTVSASIASLDDA